ncbi:MAG: CapA family protein, partial [Cyanobacteria bacterium P01_A01_bin.116]
MASASHPFNADLNSESNESSAESSANAVIEDLNSSNEPVASSDETGSPEAGDLEAGNLEVSNPAESGVAHFLRQLSDRAAVEPISAEPVSFERPPELTETPPQGFTGFAGLDVRQLAAEGYFQAIAYWINEPLIPQNVYAQVLADEVPGRLKILVEFERAPQPKRLIRFVCDRLYKLNSNVIEGVHLIARALGAAKTDWEQSIRIPTALQRVERPQKVQPSSASQLAYESSRTQVARQVMRSQFKFFRAALVSGAAAAAFLFGGFTELVLSNRLPATGQNPAPQKTIPWYGDTADADFAPVTTAQTATPVSFRPASRFKSRTVEAALETVAVSPHDAVQNPSDPTITLLFGGELSLKHFKFDAADDLDHLFSDIEIYEQADVAMVGLAEPLANASTSLQEDFYHRTRPQAVQALKTGGIDIVGLAGDGSLTYGSHGLNETLTNLDRQGIYRVGAGRNQQEAHRPEILEVKGQRIAYLGYNPDALKGAKAEKAGVALTTSKDRQHIIEDIKAIRSQVDWIVVNYRWADALETLEDTLEEKIKDVPALPSLPEDWQKSLAREAVDAGADLVVGYHPNKIQGAEIYHDRAIAYSLGDFVFQEDPLKDHDTAALRVSLRNQQMKVEFLPITIQESKLQMATGEKGAAILKTIR